ncbi:MAG: hypothetical protein HYY17_08530, partial [Planctomycetes bacterium]|nr:hypothetical protein [Planctomycetota bacterium]
REPCRATDLEVLRRYTGPRGEGAGPRYRDVAEALGLTEDAVRKRLARCRAALREILRETVREYAADEREAEAEYRRIARE